MFHIHVDPDLDILSKKLKAQIGVRPDLGTQLRFEVPGELWVINIIEM